MCNKVFVITIIVRYYKYLDILLYCDIVLKIA